jgi:putative SOS response-associated peptidase YedK
VRIFSFTFHNEDYRLTQKLRKSFGGRICFSIQIDQNITKLSATFKAALRPSKMMERDRLFRFQDEMDSDEFDQLLGLKHFPKKRNTPFKLPAVDGRIFSNYFANVIISENEQRVLQPMRYRVRPHDSKAEVPSKFNLFNARLDSLEIRQTWQPLFMKNHGIIPFTRFYEWVLDSSQKAKLISFYPEKRETMWAPCLWDEWISRDGQIHFKSFAIITDGPPDDIRRMGHDRCPIYLSEEQMDIWLNPAKTNKKNIYDILMKRESVRYLYEWCS